MINQGFGPLSLQFVAAAKSPGDADGEHACVLAGLHVGGGVTYEGDIRRRQGPAAGDFERGGWIGFQSVIGTGAVNGGEKSGWEQRLDDLPRGGLGFVRQNTKAQILIGQGGQQFGNSVVQSTVLEPAIGVDFTHAGDCGFDVIVSSQGGRQRPFGQLVHAVACEGAIGIDGMDRAAGFCKYCVETVGEAGEAVEEGSVEIKDQTAERHQIFCRTRQALVPPNPKLLVRTVRSPAASRRLVTMSNPSVPGSGWVMLAEAEMKSFSSMLRL